MARKPNHAWEKRQRELAKQAKKTAKMERKHGPREDGDDSQAGPASEAAPPADQQSPQ